MITLALFSLLTLAQTSVPATQSVGSIHMTPAGWVFMIVSNTLVIWLTAWCFYKVLSKPEAAEHIKTPANL